MMQAPRQAVIARMAALAVMVTIAAAPAIAQEAPRLGLPIACVPGETCWIVNYVDDDPGPEARDYTCGPQTYNGHSGTDFAIRDLAEMRRGVRVLASAPGIVRRLRDGVGDVSVRELAPGAIKGRECGNGVVIDHGGGWETQYCHLRKGSIRVRNADRVQRGDALGLVGLSGETEFPHVHLTVRHAGSTIDPFLGLAPANTCALGEAPLWEPDTMGQLAYRPAAIYNAGLSGVLVKFSDVRAGNHGPPVARTAEAVVFWIDVFGLRIGDDLVLRVIGPDGTTIVQRKQTFSRNRARQFAAIGKRRGASEWPTGAYVGEAVISRTGTQAMPLRISRSERVEIR